MSASVIKARSALGVAARQGDPSATLKARGDLAAAKLEQYIERIIAEAPPLTDDQRNRIASLLRGAS